MEHTHVMQMLLVVTRWDHSHVCVTQATQGMADTVASRSLRLLKPNGLGMQGELMVI